jgi:hypothetical protein
MNWPALAQADLPEHRLERAERSIRTLAEALGGEYDGHERATADDGLQPPT